MPPEPRESLNDVFALSDDYLPAHSSASSTADATPVEKPSEPNAAVWMPAPGHTIPNNDLNHFTDAFDGLSRNALLSLFFLGQLVRARRANVDEHGGITSSERPIVRAGLRQA